MPFPVEIFPAIPALLIATGYMLSSRLIIALGVGTVPGGASLALVGPDLLTSAQALAFLSLMSLCSAGLAWEVQSRLKTFASRNASSSRRSESSDDTKVETETVAERLRKIEALRARKAVQQISGETSGKNPN